MSNPEVETSENMIHIKPRTLFSLIAGLVLATNIVNKLVNDIIQNRDNIIYNDDATKRRIAHAEEKSDYKIIIEFQKIKIEELTEELKECKDANK